MRDPSKKERVAETDTLVKSAGKPKKFEYLRTPVLALS